MPTDTERMDALECMKCEGWVWYLNKYNELGLKSYGAERGIGKHYRTARAAIDAVIAARQGDERE